MKNFYSLFFVSCLVCCCFIISNLYSNSYDNDYPYSIKPNTYLNFEDLFNKVDLKNYIRLGDLRDEYDAFEKRLKERKKTIEKKLLKDSKTKSLNNMLLGTYWSRVQNYIVQEELPKCAKIAAEFLNKKQLKVYIKINQSWLDYKVKDWNLFLKMQDAGDVGSGAAVMHTSNTIDDLKSRIKYLFRYFSP